MSFEEHMRKIMANIQIDDTLPDDQIEHCKTCGGIGMVKPDANRPLVPCPHCEKGKSLSREIHARRASTTELPALYNKASLATWLNPTHEESVRESRNDGKSVSEEAQRIKRLLGRKGKILAFLTCYEFLHHPEHVISSHAVANRIKNMMPNVPAWVDNVLSAPDSLRKGFVLQGELGTGKTWLAAGVMNDLTAQGEIVLYMRAQDIITSLTNTWNKTRHDDEYETREKIVLDRYKDVPFLFIDDMNLETRGDTLLPHQKDYMEAIIRHRSNHRLHTFITCNIDKEQFYTQWGGRIADIVVSDLQWIPMAGVKFRDDTQKWGEL